jgi:hypothetical protein
MQKNETWTKEAEQKYKDVTNAVSKIDAHVANIMKGASELRKVMDVKK